MRRRKYKRSKKSTRRRMYNKRRATSKVYDEMYRVGRAKYVVNYHNGSKKHRDGSPFFDIAIFSNKVKKNNFIRELRKSGYVEKRR